MDKKWIRRAVLFLLAVAIVFGSIGFKRYNQHERAMEKYVLHEGKTITKVVDLGRQGVLKNLVNPHLFSIYGSVQTDGNVPLRCVGESDSMQMMLSQGTKKGIWDELKPTDVLRKTRGTRVALNVEIKVPREALKNTM